MPSVYASSLTFGGGPTLQWRPQPDLTLSLSAQAGARFFGVTHVSLQVRTSGGVAKSFGRWVSVRVCAAYDITGEPSALGERYVQTVFGTSGLALHFDGFDVALFVDTPLAPTFRGPDLLLASTYLF